MRSLLLTILSLLVLTCVGCNDSTGESTKTASPTPTPKSKNIEVAEREGDFQNEIDNATRAEVRQTVSDTLKSKLSSWVLKGMASEPYQNGVFWVAADIEKNGRSVVLHLVVQQFFPESGDPYWKVSLPNETLKEKLRAMNEADMWKKLNDAKNELDETKSQLENLQNPVEDDREPPDPY